MKHRAALAVLLTLAAGCHRGGKIEDSDSHVPIASAIVHVSWGHYPYLPSLHGSPHRGCEGSATASTDAVGDYRVSIPLAAALNPATIYQVRVIAPGYYDDVFRQGLAEPFDSIMEGLQWREPTGNADWSRTLRPFGSSGMDAKLLAVHASSIAESCNDEQDLAFDAQRWRVLAQTLCGMNNHGKLPSVRRDVFDFQLNRSRPDLPSDVRQRIEVLLHELVGRGSTDTGSNALPEHLVRNACVLIREQLGYPAAHPPEPLTLPLRLSTVRQRVGIADVPVRILWSVRHLDHPALGDRYSREWIARRGLVARSDVHGEILLPLTDEMLSEQAGDAFRYDVSPVTDEVIAFDEYLPISSNTPGWMWLYDRFKTRVSELRPPGELYEASSIDEAERLAGNPEPGTEVFGGTTFWRYPPRLAELMTLQAANEERTRDERRRGSDVSPGRTVQLYPWHWPAVAMLWRAHALIAAEPDVESDPGALTALQYEQSASTFESLCSEPDEPMTARETFEALQLLWWTEAQSDRGAADERARQRATAWDRGATCTFERQRMTRMDRTGAPIHSKELCRAWRSIPAVSSPVLRPYRFKDLVLDFDNRPGACPQFQNNGAFQ